MRDQGRDGVDNQEPRQQQDDDAKSGKDQHDGVDEWIGDALGDHLPAKDLAPRALELVFYLVDHSVDVGFVVGVLSHPDVQLVVGSAQAQALHGLRGHIAGSGVGDAGIQLLGIVRGAHDRQRFLGAAIQFDHDRFANLHFQVVQGQSLEDHLLLCGRPCPFEWRDGIDLHVGQIGNRSQDEVTLAGTRIIVHAGSDQVAALGGGYAGDLGHALRQIVVKGLGVDDRRSEPGAILVAPVFAHDDFPDIEHYADGVHADRYGQRDDQRPCPVLPQVNEYLLPARS